MNFDFTAPTRGWPTISFTLLLFSGLLVSGCKDDIEKMELSEKEKARVIQIQNPFGVNLIRFSVLGEKEPVSLGMKDCKIYRAKNEQGVVTGWEQSLNAIYLSFTACTRQSIEYDGQYVKVFICEQAIGAGGGCAAGGNYRSRDGKLWEKLNGNKWEKAVGEGRLMP